MKLHAIRCTRSPRSGQGIDMSDTSQAAKVRFQVEGMDCASCATKIENALQRMRGVTEVNVSVTGGTVTVGHDDKRISNR